MSKHGPLLSKGHWYLEAGKQIVSVKISGGRHRNIDLSVHDENQENKIERSKLCVSPLPSLNMLVFKAYMLNE